MSADNTLVYVVRHVGDSDIERLGEAMQYADALEIIRASELLRPANEPQLDMVYVENGRFASWVL